MRLVQLKNHSERQDFLRKATTIAAEDQAVGKSSLTEELITRSQELHKKYQEENTARQCREQLEWRKDRNA